LEAISIRSVEGAAAGFCHPRFWYKRQLTSVGDALLETQPEHAEKATIELKETGKL